MEQEYNDEQTSTTGATFSTKTMNFGDKALCFEIWDTAGQEKYRALTKMFYIKMQVLRYWYMISQGKYLLRN